MTTLTASITLLLVTASCILCKPAPTAPLSSQQGSTTGLPSLVNESHPFLLSIFQKYGQNMLMTFEGFEHLLEDLHLGHPIIDDHKKKQQRDGPVFKDFQSLHEQGPCPLRPNQKPSVPALRKPDVYVKDNVHNEAINAKRQHKHGDYTAHDHHKRSPPYSGDIGVSLKKCLTAYRIMLFYGIRKGTHIDPVAFREICPALISQLVYRSCCHSYPGYLDINNDWVFIQTYPDNKTDSHSAIIDSWDFFNIPLRVWGFASAAVLVISLAGLVGVAAVPLMRKVFYMHVLHFLVALAVGSLTGDAVLHLIPHAIQSESSHSHNDSGGHDRAAVYKGLMVLGGIYMFFLAEQLMSIFTTWRRKRKSSPKSKRGKYMTDIGIKLSLYSKQMSQEDPMLDQGALDSQSEKIADSILEETHMTQKEEEEVSGHGHSHFHSVEQVPQSISAVAWMVIMGDGLHNFCDGLAIGAAFVSSIMGGVSTSVAVICHEFPHELGDFAMLLRAGMSVRQALVYNLLSSFLCFVGMVIGIALGNVSSASAWIFGVVAGMFLYIALVDMLPEITSSDSKCKTSPCCHLLIQFGGITLGSTVMLLIALYEEQLKSSLAT